MTKIHREFFKDGILKREVFYDSETTIVLEMKRYNPDGSLIFSGDVEYKIKLEDFLKPVSIDTNRDRLSDTAYVDEEALQTEQAREEADMARELREAEEERRQGFIRAAAESEARLKSAERFIGRQLGSNDLA
jgi:hypothetical protein